MTTPFINLSFYRFCDLDATKPLEQWRTEILAYCQSLNLKGTILIAAEGINGMLTGPVADMKTFETYAIETLGIAPDVLKETFVEKHSFTRMLVKIKKEIIPVGNPNLKPHVKTAQRMPAETLKQWLDEGRDFILLDTRNDYEISVGTFNKAIDLNIFHSRQFSEKATAKATEKDSEWATKPVVTFCTGGIRCEKASAVLLEAGLTDVYQLDGGIIRYLEKNGAAHFKGNCFVFDWRLAVDGNLNPAPRGTSSAPHVHGYRNAPENMTTEASTVQFKAQ